MKKIVILTNIDTFFKCYLKKYFIQEINRNAEELITEEERERRKAEKRRAKKKVCKKMLGFKSILFIINNYY